MKPHWLVRPETVRRLWIAFLVILVLTVLAELLIERHPQAVIDALFGFNAWYGFAACVALVLVARLIGFALKRPDDFYDR